MTRFADAATIWLARLDEQVQEGRHWPATTTPLADKVICGIKRKVSPATAKTCRSVISGVMSLAVRQGAVMVNPFGRSNVSRPRPSGSRVR
jgi:hypothetical protein